MQGLKDEQQNLRAAGGNMVAFQSVEFKAARGVGRARRSCAQTASTRADLRWTLFKLKNLEGGPSAVAPHSNSLNSGHHTPCQGGGGCVKTGARHRMVRWAIVCER
jgi:hypothetical protein